MASARAREQPRPEHEIKLVTPAARAATVSAWLAGRCPPDPKYPTGLVTSIYYDNRDAELLRAKINSDFIKYKVRARWYGDPRSGAVLEPAFIELKRKVGGRRFKTRLPLDVPAAQIAAARPSTLLLRRLLAGLREQGHWAGADLQPFLRIGFRRHRFIEPTTGSRISVDFDIRGCSVNPALLPQSNPAALAHAVIEVKGPAAELPRRLAWLRDMGCQPDSFSKYARCFLKITRRSSF
ncbi:MAG: VTC domain-containing protein [Acidobacteriota bacterium]|jgi:hypothetical protein